VDGPPDGSDDRSYSRAPEVDDLVELCRALNDAGALYVLIGGFAVILHGYVRATKDVDLLVDLSPDNIRAVKAGMASLPDNAVSLMEDDEVERYGVVRVADEFVVDLMARACGLVYADALRLGIERMTVAGVEIPVASKRFLIRSKQTVRPHDAEDVAFLERLLEHDRGDE
jgi:hypothetical protein